MANAKTASSTTKPRRYGRIKGLSNRMFVEKKTGRAASGKFKNVLKSGTTEALLTRNVRTLMKTVGAGIKESRKSGRATRFVVELDPNGRLRILRGDKASGKPQAATGSSVTVHDGELEQSLEAARARGHLRAVEILHGEEMLNADKFARLLGVSRVTVNAKRQKHEVLALDGAKRGFRFPSWQLDENGKPFAAIPDLFEHLGDSGWTIYRFLVQRHPELDGLSALEALKRGHAKKVIETADGVSRGNFA